MNELYCEMCLQKGKMPISFSVYYDVFETTGLRFKKNTDTCCTCDVFETKSRFLQDLKTNIVYYKIQLWTMNETIRDLGDDTSYCFLWHEALVGRGSDQVVSVRYMHIQANIPGNAQKLTTFSDTCAR
ncbi:hypothetical protein PR048_012657 [Dryococelus australis]|uniref:Uncharacterized protein n=1 Tax=Dryococelus australis TaxID=614101 RepID=A0ABQ9HQU2_9NEOP|nr:hypothetical protein PR048_012657 [Dryococelus australis]